MRHVLVLVALMSASALASAIPEEGFARTFESQVVPAYLNGGTFGTFDGVDNVPIHYVTFERQDARCALVMLNGRGGSTLEDMELLYDVHDWGCSVYAMDHRGQGQSGRMIPENRFKGHVEHFQDYIDDVKKFMDVVVNRRPHDKTVMLGVSMGGAIATIFAEQFPSEIDGLVLVVPMHLPFYAQFPEDVAALIGEWAELARKQRQYAIGQDDPDPNPPFEENDGSQSRARFDGWRKTVAMFPEIDLGGPTYRWVFEALKATKRSRVDAFKVTVPTLMLQAGKDKTVNNTGSTAVCNRIRHCRRVVYPNAAHGMFYETDATRDQALQEVHAFVDQVQPAPGCSSAGVTPWALLVVALLLRRTR